MVHGLIQVTHLLLNLDALVCVPLVHRLDLLLRVFRIERLVNFVLRTIRILNLLLVLLERVAEVVLLEVLFTVVGFLLKHALI